MDYRRRNYRILLITEAISAMSGGFSVPFFILFFYKFGGSGSVLGTAIAIAGIFSAIASYYAGKLSDKLGRKIMLISTSISAGALVILYSLIQNACQIYFLQAFVGIVGAMYAVAQQTLLADITQKINRGKDIGRFHMVVGLLAAIFTLIGGLFVEKIPFGIVFVFLGLVFILDTIPLFFIQEKIRKKLIKYY